MSPHSPKTRQAKFAHRTTRRLMKWWCVSRLIFLAFSPVVGHERVRFNWLIGLHPFWRLRTIIVSFIYMGGGGGREGGTRALLAWKVPCMKTAGFDKTSIWGARCGKRKYINIVAALYFVGS